ncbi:MAG: hypothetical protein M3247_06400 [Thermoproteota archaeon]|nr:hypothetical protein [Thermoproteota archaeon]
MVSKNDNKHVLATLALMLLSFGVTSLIAINAPHYARAQGVTVEGVGNATNATSTSGGETAGGTQIGGPLSLYGGGGGQ